MSMIDTGHPCETCLRWSECNGVDAANCPAVRDFNKKKEDPDHWRNASEKNN
jgi:hypothetical protein